MHALHLSSVRNPFTVWKNSSLHWNGKNAEVRQSFLLFSHNHRIMVNHNKSINGLFGGCQNCVLAEVIWCTGTPHGNSSSDIKHPAEARAVIPNCPCLQTAVSICNPYQGVSKQPPMFVKPEAEFVCCSVRGAEDAHFFFFRCWAALWFSSKMLVCPFHTGQLSSEDPFPLNTFTSPLNQKNFQKCL